MNITREEAYEIIIQAREKLISEGLRFPEIDKNVHIKTNEDGDVYFAFDFDINEEKYYRFVLVRLEQIICEMRGEEWKPMPTAFGVYFDENFDKDIPEKWYTASGTEPPNKRNKKNKKEDITDQYQTYSNIKKTSQEHKQNVDDDTYNNIDIPDTYSE